jgi:hypothetical protein
MCITENSPQHDKYDLLDNIGIDLWLMSAMHTVLALAALL